MFTETKCSSVSNESRIPGFRNYGEAVKPSSSNFNFPLQLHQPLFLVFRMNYCTLPYEENSPNSCHLVVFAGTWKCALSLVFLRPNSKLYRAQEETVP